MKKSFSLIELIFVILIIGIISTIAVPKLFNLSQNATTKTLLQDIQTIKTSIQSYYLINSKLDKINDSVKINPKYWDIEDFKITYKENEKECIKIEVNEDILTIQIHEEVGKICQELFQNGVQSEEFNLIL